MNDQELQNQRHSLAHLLAAAVREIYPDAKRTIGPAIDNGFYYDFDFPTPISDKDLTKIEKKMRELLPSWTEFTGVETSVEDAKNKVSGNEYKEELISELEKAGEKITFYSCGSFEDLCRGGHLENPSNMDPESFKLDRIAGAYWRGDEKNKMLTRIYGLAFESKEKLDEYLHQREEAEKRDHKKLGKELELFFFHPTAPGLAYWLPNGVTLMNELISFWRKEHVKRGYKEISAPLINKKELWETSGHWEHYREDMFVADMGENDVYGVKAMNCPNAMVMFGSRPRSYKELPLRLSDTDTLHRYERAGTLNGLLRARSFRQDDSHNFISEDQIEAEYLKIFEITELFYGIFGLSYRFRLGTRPEGFLGEVKTWNNAEKILKDILEKSGKEYFVADGDGAFYGPKVDIVMKDALGRDWQMGTIQLDFQQPKRFGLEYIAADGSRKMPVVIHRVIYGSLERFIGILIEHTAGAFPLWLSPVQVAVLPISEKHIEYAKHVVEELADKVPGIRYQVDDRSESIGKKIREATAQKIPYMLILGDKEKEAGTVAVRKRNGEDLGSISPEELSEKLNHEIISKTI